MPRKRALTRQPGFGNRQGRWTKKYQGQKLYLGSAPSKSDQAAYDRALDVWMQKKTAEIDLAGRPKPHQALLNKNGAPLVVATTLADGRHSRYDAISNAFGRLRAKANVTWKSLKIFRKTSVSLIAGNERFSELRELFPGLAPSSIADRHYAVAPQDLLEEALGWLRTKLQIAELQLG